MNNKRLYSAVLVLVVISFLSCLFLSYSTFGLMLFERKNASTIIMDDLVMFGRNNTFSNGVPRIVHYNYKDSMIPFQYIPLVIECVRINPNVKFVFWSDLSSFNFLARHFPTYLELYKSYLKPGTEKLKKSDVVRYFIMYYFGGIYMDLDTRCQRPLEEAMDQSCILSREAEVHSRIIFNVQYLVMNSFMACVSNHAFFMYLIKHLSKDDNSDILALTGPIFMTLAFTNYNAKMNASYSEDRQKYVIVSPSYTFSPLTERFLEYKCVDKHSLGGWRLKGCKALAEFRKEQPERISKAVVVHLFSHLGYEIRSNLVKRLYHIGKVTSAQIVI